MGKVSELLLENEALKSDLAAAREQMAETREALAEYGRHTPFCELSDPAFDEGPRVDTICTCGLEQALSAAPAGEVLLRLPGKWFIDTIGRQTLAIARPVYEREDLNIWVLNTPNDLERLEEPEVSVTITKAPCSDSSASGSREKEEKTDD